MDERGRMALGRYLAQQRVSAGINQPELAKRTGMSVEKIILIEEGLSCPSQEDARTIAKALGVNPNAVNIFFGVTAEQRELLTRELPSGASLSRQDSGKE